MSKLKILKTTDHRRTYNLVRKEMYAACPRCRWHAIFQKSCPDFPYEGMRYYEDGIDKPEKLKYRFHPNWKLVSKNKKQWKKKKFLSERIDFHDGTFYIRFGW
ncbi:hypothetical protein HF324_03430 [Chitinophaga oryzae]|uniref:Uncharacterized protein n=1 Tax=Chitinophaga oryzae TaxID=2725414 RepID=A0AAE6ZCX3_9BACT|nr:hypothetical protein [Chitinophaga oryzae]QJB30446.1 hypothetical protein HF329_03670 [Chitinophaga oryzae]QJB36956.1 hypothetical protein HF324_03430 [Chitinophaga oryzae]